MRNLFAQKDAWLGRMRQKHAATQVIYLRGGEQVMVLAARVAVPVTLTESSGVTVESERIDWTIEADQLVIAGVETRPLEGDRIVWMRGSVKETYEAVPVGTTSHYQEVGEGTAWIVHTRLIGQE